MPPVPVEILTRTDEDEVQVVDDLDVLSEGNRCSCAASDDNPY